MSLRIRTLLRVLRSYPWRLPAVLADDRTLRRAMAGLEAVPSIEGVVVPTLQGGPLRVFSPPDLSELREVIVSNMYCAPDFVPRSGWTVVDVGASLGFFSVWARLGMRRGLLVAVEPVPVNLEVYRVNVQGPVSRPTGRGPRVVVVPMAAADRARTLDILLPRRDGAWAQAAGWACAAHTRCADLVLAAGSNERLKVGAAPLDELLRDAIPARAAIDLLKVDVEGMEAECFRGAAGSLARTRRVVFEYHGAALLQECSALLREVGMRERLRRHPYRGGMGLSFWGR